MMQLIRFYCLVYPIKTKSFVRLKTQSVTCGLRLDLIYNGNYHDLIYAIPPPLLTAREHRQKARESMAVGAREPVLMSKDEGCPVNKCWYNVTTARPANAAGSGSIRG